MRKGAQYRWGAKGTTNRKKQRARPDFRGPSARYEMSIGEIALLSCGSRYMKPFPL